VSLDWQPIAAAGLGLQVPADWRQMPDATVVGLGLMLAAAGPADTGFSPNIVCAQERLPAGCDLDAWQQRSVETMQNTVMASRLLDVAAAELAGQPAALQLVCYRFEAWSLTAFQWLSVNDAVGLILTATCATSSFSGLRETLLEIGASLEVSANG